jgi:predicted DCC family thiol-disulfide oxidoreductase YuxK
MSSENDQLWLVYDEECPFCSSYVGYVRIKDNFGQLNLVDARQGGELVENIIKLGYDLNDGMVLKYQDRYYHGADCINVLALMSTNSGLFNKINAAIFKSATVSGFLYPILRAGRNMTLKLLRKKKLER